jgi:hypothetical protein
MAISNRESKSDEHPSEREHENNKRKNSTNDSLPSNNIPKHSKLGTLKEKYKRGESIFSN